jgi:hypothetical protein
MNSTLPMTWPSEAVREFGFVLPNHFISGATIGGNCAGGMGAKFMTKKAGIRVCGYQQPGRSVSILNQDMAGR